MKKEYPKMIYKVGGGMVKVKGHSYDYKTIQNESELREALNGGWQLEPTQEKVKPEPNEEIQPEIQLEEQVFELKETENKEPVKRRGRPRKV